MGVEQRSGAATLFEQFYAGERHAAAELGWLLTRDRVAAEDVAQEAFTAVFSRFEQLEHPRAYLRRSIVNAVYERSRRAEREGRRHRLVAAAIPSEVDGPTGGLVDIVARLPLRQRSAVVMRYWAGMTDAEIADVLGVRKGTVRSLLSRGIATLREEVR